ncbi:MAG: AmmeMemoRadiSam system radical SAM enzyme [Desulfobacterium sp.]|nr:AmmeMemoRadiSam system radical SAM enzyme [Desulfobacterium sp.]
METLIYEKLDNKKVRCGICNHFCTIDPGRRGLCSVRENQEGRLINLVHGRIVARGIDPVEKKPIFHLKPGSLAYSIATVGCNFRCSFCQNADIAQMPTEQNGQIRGVEIEPETIVEQALKGGCASIAYTYTEPAVFIETVLETAKIAAHNELFNILVTNGYMSREAIEMIAPYIDAANVDLKAFNDDFYRKYCKAKIEPVKENLKLMKRLGILVEVTTLLIPGLNDDPGQLEAMAAFIADELGVETPWHVSRFHPCYRMMDRDPTPVSSIKRAASIGKAAGLRYVYTGNVPGLEGENTLCHSCGRTLVDRRGYVISSTITPEGRCPDCNTLVYGIY